MELLWPPYPLPNATYYVALYFANDQDSFSGRAFDISLNGVLFYRKLNVTAAGVMVFANQWPLSGITNVTLARGAGSSIAPLINAGEIFRVMPLGGRTHTRDGMVVLIYFPAKEYCCPGRLSWIICSFFFRIISYLKSNLHICLYTASCMTNLITYTNLSVQGTWFQPVI